MRQALLFITTNNKPEILQRGRMCQLNSLNVFVYARPCQTHTHQIRTIRQFKLQIENARRVRTRIGSQRIHKRCPAHNASKKFYFSYLFLPNKFLWERTMKTCEQDSNRRMIANKFVERNAQTICFVFIFFPFLLRLCGLCSRSPASLSLSLSLLQNRTQFWNNNNNNNANANNN